jgi:hypothetical protein
MLVPFQLSSAKARCRRAGGRRWHVECGASSGQQGWSQATAVSEWLPQIGPRPQSTLSEVEGPGRRVMPIRGDESWGTSARRIETDPISRNPPRGVRVYGEVSRRSCRSRRACRSKPGDAVVHVNAKSTIMQPDTHGRILTDSFELQRRMACVGLQQRERLVRE